MPEPRRIPLADAEATTRLGAAIAPMLKPGDPPVAHFDLYRLTRPEEALEIGLDDALDVGCVIIEWPERLGDDPAEFLGPDRLVIEIAEDGDGRVATVSGAGAWKDRIQHVGS